MKTNILISFIFRHTLEQMFVTLSPQFEVMRSIREGSYDSTSKDFQLGCATPHLLHKRIVLKLLIYGE